MVGTMKWGKGMRNPFHSSFIIAFVLQLEIGKEIKSSFSWKPKPTIVRILIHIV